MLNEPNNFEEMVIFIIFIILIIIVLCLPCKELNKTNGYQRKAVCLNAARIPNTQVRPSADVIFRQMTVRFGFRLCLERVSLVS